MTELSPSQRHQEKRMAWYNEYLANTPCAECGESLSAKYMTFRYNDESENDLSTAPHILAQRGYSVGRIIEELAKGHVYCKWHALEIDYMRKTNALIQRYVRDKKQLSAQYAEDYDREVRVELGVGDSLAETISQELLVAGKES